MNFVGIIGRMVADPELKSTNSGTSVTTFTLAVDRRYVAKGEERQTDWIDCVAWRNTAEFICKNFKKGSPIAIAGELQTRNWEDKEGKKHKAVEVNIANAEFVPRDSKAEDKPKNDDFVEVDDTDLPF